MNARADPASIRDPGGRVFVHDGRILRAVYEKNAADYEAARDAGMYTYFSERDWLLASKEIETSASAAGENAAYLLEHPRLPFVSYPYEWPFSLHKKAAILQLNILIEALDRNFTLSDASAYNVQFRGVEPCFIDHLSFVRYQEGQIWAAHRQFCMQFLNPLIMWARLRVAPNCWFRGGLEGIPPEDLSRLLRWRDLLSWTILSHVSLQGAMQRRANSAPASAMNSDLRQLPRSSYKAILFQLRAFVMGLARPDEDTTWRKYDTDNGYDEGAAVSKRQFVQRMVGACQPNLLFDLGCNTGEYSAAAIDAGANSVIGFDFDFGALELAVERAEKGSLPLLPLWIDATNPTPCQGWAQHERMGLAERAEANAVLALAFVHHLAIARNIPLDLVVEWIMSLAPVGVIEFPAKSDPMVQVLLSRRVDIFPDYDEKNFESAIAKRGRIIEMDRLPGGRLLAWFERI